ncbi:hypothetical protein RM553_17355 [Zunongwangia sp. F363]|uniref:Curlin n=1 Tax=Autumnicola tepida TaxID=3075595 RepID=A0ABU3CE45_9FLAO|nr:hypothetical protein [Zunongwangia sp. F363]MDT0644610.1 hypothetical protein [Zunongwangia sp. F363]
MKKVILSAAALMFGAVTFAQQDVNHAERQEASQVTNHSSDVDANRADVDQWNTSQKAFVQQVGERNSAQVDQSDGAYGGTGGNQAMIYQSGPYSLSGPWYNLQYESEAEDNQAEVNQAGTTNESALYQRGSNNDARSDQGLDGSASDNKVAIYQGDFDNYPYSGNSGNDAFAKQEGSENSSLIAQDDNNNDAMTAQDGDGNKVYVTQTSRQDGSVDEGQMALVEQYGDMNESTVAQDGRGARNNATTYQLGNNNKAWQKQYNTSDDAGDENTATITQGTLGYIPSDYAIAIQDQRGEDNEASITQYDGNEVASNYAQQDQDGDDNDAAITQENVFEGHDNFAKQIQDGNYNEAIIGQKGDGHKAQQWQKGNNNFAESHQQGKDHKAFVWQRYDNNYAFTNQNNIGNDALVVQSGGQSATVDQLDGSGNEATVFQSGPYGMPYGAPQHCDFDSPIGTPSVPTPDDLTLADPCPDCN